MGHRREWEQWDRPIEPLAQLCGVWHRANQFNAGDEQCREEMDCSVGFFDRDLGDIASGSEDEVGMIDAIFASIGHKDDEALKRDRTKQVADALFHGGIFSMGTGIVSTGRQEA